MEKIEDITQGEEYLHRLYHINEELLQMVKFFREKESDVISAYIVSAYSWTQALVDDICNDNITGDQFVKRMGEKIALWEKTTKECKVSKAV